MVKLSQKWDCDNNLKLKFVKSKNQEEMEDTPMMAEDPVAAAEKFKNQGNDQFKMKNF